MCTRQKLAKNAPKIPGKCTFLLALALPGPFIFPVRELHETKAMLEDELELAHSRLDELVDAEKKIVDLKERISQLLEVSFANCISCY